MRPDFSCAVLLAALVAAPALAQPLSPEAGPVFEDSTLPTVRLTLHPDTLAWILDPDNAESDIEWRATFVWDDGTAQETVEEIGFRLRGNTSRQAAKKSFKVSFNTYQRGREWNGLDKMNLNGEHNDPTVLRSQVAWGLVRAMRIPGSRTNPVRLVINGDDFGVYANVEHIDDEFLNTHFRDGSGTLYKCLYPADLNDLGSNPAAYRDLAPFGRPVYELTTGDGDHADLAAFIQTLNRTPSATFPETIEGVLDVNGYLRVLAMDILTGNWDGYAYNQNNFYLYNDPELGLFRYIPFDLDNTLGIDFLGRDWGTRSLYDWPIGPNTGAPPRPLAKRLLVVPDYRERLTFYLRQLLNGPYAAAEIEPRIAVLRTLIADAVAADPYYPRDYGWDADDFAASFDSGLGGHVDYGLVEFINTRRSTALAQLDAGNVAPLLSERRTSPARPFPGQPVTVRVWVEDEGTPSAVDLTYRVDGGDWQTVPMTDEGDGVYAAAIGAFDRGTTVDYTIEARDVVSQTRTDPRRGIEAPASFTVVSPASTGLVVNELMASNDATIADEAGEFDDWVELYNGTGAPVSLDGLFFTDDVSEPDKVALPDTVMAPDSYLLIWADDDTEQGPLHVPFKLSARGEDAALFMDDGSGGFTLIDGISFGEQTTDVSFGRNAADPSTFVLFTSPTPRAPNGVSIALEATAEANALAILSAFPNPVRDRLTVSVQVASSTRLSLDIVDMLGRQVGMASPRLVSAGEHQLTWRGELAAGVYSAVVRADALGRVTERSTRITILP
ncbi:MAG: CotH kinase family protein [Bacteroidota bacterium]